MFKAIIIIALVGLASAADTGVELNDDFSQFALATTNNVEVSGLKGTLKVFEPFCITTRDLVFNDIEDNTNNGASKAFTMLFSLVEALGSAGLNAIIYGNQKLTPQIANPSAPIEDLHNANDYETMINGGQHAVQDTRTQPKSFVEAFKSVVAASSSAVAKAFNEKISQIKDIGQTLGSMQTLEAICDKVADYENELQNRFTIYKGKVAAENKDLVKADITLNKVPCTTSTRIIRINSICQFAKTSAPAVQKLWATRAQKEVEAPKEA